MSEAQIARIRTEPTPLQVSVESAVGSFSSAPDPAILESVAPGTATGRFSIFACDPAQVLTVEALSGEDPLETLQAAALRYPTIRSDPTDPALGCGWIGYISYEAGLNIEGLRTAKEKDLSLPVLRFGLYDAAAVFDHAAKQWYLTAVDWTGLSPVPRPAVRERLDMVRRRLDAARALELGTMEPAPMLDICPPRANMTETQYAKKVNRAHRYIAAGDIYQVNLTQRFTARCDLSPTTLYRRLRRLNPSSYAALLKWDDRAILSSSPELFLELHNSRVTTRPIKGTRPRTGDSGLDERRCAELAASPKDRAELNMIIDLLRNDLGRVCRFGSVRVTDADAIEAHPTVFHRVATIEGRLRPEHDWYDLFRATFPGGSITGAPKIRAMQIIDELEPTPRGVYCGSIGWIGLDGSMCMNIAIRTMVQTGSVVQVHAGGAIVADSRAEDEYEEIMAKARGMFAALGCTAPLSQASHREAHVA